MAASNLSLRDLLDRLTRIIASEAWSDDLNPTQRAALNYLARANRFSRSPSHVADYLCATRGTVSQTLKALARKGLVEEMKSETDRRSIAYRLTRLGEAVAISRSALDDVMSSLTPLELDTLTDGLSSLVRQTIAKQGGRSFGVCRTCAHHRRRGSQGWCALLDVDLNREASSQICHEHKAAA